MLVCGLDLQRRKTAEMHRSLPFNMSSEPSCANQYSTPPTTEDVVVGPGNVPQLRCLIRRPAPPDAQARRGETDGTDTNQRRAEL